MLKRVVLCNKGKQNTPLRQKIMSKSAFFSEIVFFFSGRGCFFIVFFFFAQPCWEDCFMAFTCQPAMFSYEYLTCEEKILFLPFIIFMAVIAKGHMYWSIIVNAVNTVTTDIS